MRPAAMLAVRRATPAGGCAPRVLLAVLALCFGGCGAGHAHAAQGARARLVGSGVQAAWVLTPRGHGPFPVVVFLHGWGANRPGFYRPWLDHLVAEGNAVIYPRYQASSAEPPPQVLGNALAGIRHGLGAVRTRAGTLVVAGHSAGGALAADYAAIAPLAGLPGPRAVFSAYPGVRLPRVPFALPLVDPARIPGGTLVEALGSRADGVVGTAVARRIAARAHGRYVAVTDPAVGDHLGPQRSGPATRRVFWASLDRLLARARR